MTGNRRRDVGAYAGRCGVSGVAPDPLDRAQALITQAPQTDAEDWAVEVLPLLMMLVEIARAARELYEEIASSWLPHHIEHDSSYAQQAFSRANTLATVRDALARLDKDTA